MITMRTLTTETRSTSTCATRATMRGEAALMMNFRDPEPRVLKVARESQGDETNSMPETIANYNSIDQF